MVIITDSIKDVLSIKLKLRHDDLTDQFNRIFMAKMFIISSLVMGVDFFSDRVSCILTSESHLSRDFVHSACWIQGFYIYKEMKNHATESGYYGIPKDVDVDGVYPDTDKLCRRVNKATHLLDTQCKEMTKVFYTQFQYFPFYVASLAVAYYAPYVLFRVVNRDLINLRKILKSGEPEANITTQIMEGYFNHGKSNRTATSCSKIGLNILIKVLYTAVAVLSFVFTDELLNGKYIPYGMEWIRWSKRTNYSSHPPNFHNNVPKPGEKLLPAMGLCDIIEGSKDIRSTFTNQNKFICEISPNVLYQYVLLVLWFLFVSSIVISSIGVALKCSRLIYTAFSVRISKELPRNKRELMKVLSAELTLRELQYLQSIQNRNTFIYQKLIRRLTSNYANLEICRPDQRLYDLTDDYTKCNFGLRFEQNVTPKRGLKKITKKYSNSNIETW